MSLYRSILVWLLRLAAVGSVAVAMFGAFMSAELDDTLSAQGISWPTENLLLDLFVPTFIGAVVILGIAETLALLSRHARNEEIMR